MSEDIHFETRNALGLITLDKQSALNAVNEDMLRRLDAQLDIWQADDAVKAVLIRAVEGRAFSAGGDIRNLYNRGRAGTPSFDFFAFEYGLNARIARFPKPYIALVNGIAMGGGVGVSFHGSHRVAGENISFAMPEVGIGFFPDVGASYLLNQLPGETGLYLALTGARMNRADCVWSGLATSAVRAAQQDDMIMALSAGEAVDDVLAHYHSNVGEEEVGPVQAASTSINRWFDAPDVTSIIERINQDAAQDEFAQRSLRQLQGKSPTSLAIAFEQMKRGKGLALEACLDMEYRILRRVLVEPEFYEGIRAAIIDKDNAPQWSPSNIEDVSSEQVARYFAPLDELELGLS